MKESLQKFGKWLFAIIKRLFHIHKARIYAEIDKIIDKEIDKMKTAINNEVDNKIKNKIYKDMLKYNINIQTEAGKASLKSLYKNYLDYYLREDGISW